MTAEELDMTAARLEEIRLEEEKLRSKLQEQVEEFGFREVCPDGLFNRLFRTVTKFTLADGATLVLASPLPEGAPRNLRLMFSRAVETRETSPRLRIEKIEAACGAECVT